MQKCTIYHTGVYTSDKGVIKDNKVYFQAQDDQLYFPKEIFLAREECEGGLIQFEVDGKWGFADIYTGEIKIKPVWGYAGPFYRGYAHVASEVELVTNGGTHIEGGKHGYIDSNGKLIIPLEYDYADDIPYRKYFEVSKNGKKGLIDKENKTIVNFQWDYLETSYGNQLIFCGRKETCDLYVGAEDKLLGAIMKMKPEPTCNYKEKWGVYDGNFNLIVEPELDKRPIKPMIKTSARSKNYTFYEEYFILKKGEKYGVLCKDGSLIANIEFSKEKAVEMVNSVSGRPHRDLYID